MNNKIVSVIMQLLLAAAFISFWLALAYAIESVVALLGME